MTFLLNLGAYKVGGGVADIIGNAGFRWQMQQDKAAWR